MRFGLVCFVLIFLGTEFFQWVMHLTWLSEVELSFPLMLLAGVGLAIASNTKRLKPRSVQPVKPNPPPLASPAKPIHAPPKMTPAPTQVASIGSAAGSISFKVRKPFQR
jgi:hypothetical protein